MSLPVLFELRNNVGIIILNRPDKLNAFNQEMSLALQEKLDLCAANSAIRSVYLSGSGKAFSAGQDLSEVSGDPVIFEKILSEQYNPIVTRIRKIEKPVVAAVNGIAAGAGANIALCCDIVVAAHAAYFLQAFSKIGLIPDSGGTYFLPRLIGWQKASALMMLADKLSAAEAERIGMIYKVFADETFAESSIQIAETLAHMPTKALALTKHLLNSSLTNSFESQLTAENIAQQQAAKTSDFNEGLKAFLEKRLPKFKGE